MKKEPSSIKEDDPKNPILGERHDYQDESEKNLTNKAQKLGFSSEEIKQLARLYLDK